MNLQDLINLPEKSIYGFFNESDKICYIAFSRNTLNAINRNIQEFKYRNNVIKQDLNKLELRIIETIDDLVNLRIRYQYWTDHFTNIGYRHYRSYKGASYKLSIEVIGDLMPSYHTKFLFYVYLVSRGYNRILIGIFDNKDEMDSFISREYRNIDKVTYADNKLTREYLATNK